MGSEVIYDEYDIDRLEVLCVKGVAEALGVSSSTVYRWIREGYLPCLYYYTKYPYHPRYAKYIPKDVVRKIKELQRASKRKRLKGKYIAMAATAFRGLQP